MNKWFCLLLVILTLCLGGCKKEKEEIPENITFQSQVLMDTEQLYLAVTDIRETTAEGCVMDLEIRNQTDSNLLFSMGKAAVNGCMCNPYFDESIAAGQTLTAQAVFDADTLAGYGITKTTVIEFHVSVRDEDSTEECLIEETFTLYPRGKAHKHYQTRKPQKTDRVLMDNDTCSIILTAVHDDSFWGYDLGIYLVNKTDRTLLFTADEAFLNQVACDPYWTTTVLPGKCSNTTMYWFDHDLEDAGITQVNEISMLVNVSDLADWIKPILSETVTIDMK